MKVHRRHNPEPHIPFIALADIAWQIIIFFLIASTFAAGDALKVDMPHIDDSVKNESKADNALTIVASQKSLTLNGEAVSIQRLAGELENKLKGKTSEQDRAVVFIGKEDLEFQRNADILFAVQKAGGILILADED